MQGRHFVRLSNKDTSESEHLRSKTPSFLGPSYAYLKGYEQSEHLSSIAHMLEGEKASPEGPSPSCVYPHSLSLQILGFPRQPCKWRHCTVDMIPKEPMRVYHNLINM